MGNKQLPRKMYTPGIEKNIPRDGQEPAVQAQEQGAHHSPAPIRKPTTTIPPT